MFEDREQMRLVVVLWDCFLHFQQGLAAPDLEARYMVVEPGLFVHEVPADVRFFDVGQTREYFSDLPTLLRPAEAHGEAFGEAKRVSQGGACRLVDGGLDAVAEVHFGQVAVVHVAGEDRYRGGTVAVCALARGDGAPQAREVGDGFLESWPVLKVDELADRLADPGCRAAPGSCADGLVRGLQMMKTRAQEEGERGAEEEVIEVARGFLHDPGPLLFVEHGAVAFLQNPTCSRVHHDETDPAEVAVVAPARTGDLAVRPV